MLHKPNQTTAKMPNLSLDEIKDLSVRIVSTMVLNGLIVDCTDTDDSTEFDIQDIIVAELCSKFNVEND
jgi:hypothetical protein